MTQLQPHDLLKQARARYSQRELATLLDVDIRTVRRWEARETDPPPYLADAIRQRILPLAGYIPSTEQVLSVIVNRNRAGV